MGLELEEEPVHEVASGIAPQAEVRASNRSQLAGES